MTFEFRPAKLEAGVLFIALSGPSWSGKTYSSLRLATGIADGGKIVGIDTENGRMLHYANKFQYDHVLLDPPFSPQRYGEVIRAAAALNPSVVIIDSLTHEHTGEGGVLDMHDAETASGKKDPTAWILPKRARKRLIMDILRLKCHVIVCMRAEDQTEWVKDANGKVAPVPKRTLSGHVGWIPVVGKEWPYEFTVSLLLTPEALGVPKPVKLYEELKPLVPLDQPLTEDVGRQLASWAAGASSGAVDIDSPSAPAAPDVRFASEPQRRKIFAEAKKHGVDTDTLKRMLAEFTGQESSAAIPADRVDVILAAIESVGVAS